MQFSVCRSKYHRQKFSVFSSSLFSLLQFSCIRYLEEEVLPVRQKLALKTTVCRLDRSPHVGHLKQDRAQYVHHLEQFCRDCLP
jgi:hypothetical protein